MKPFYTNFLIILAIISNINFTFASTQTLFPPINIPFLKDVYIKKYLKPDLLSHFEYTGDWQVDINGNGNGIIGKSTDYPCILISRDKLSAKPKSFKMDFVVESTGTEYAFFLGKAGVVVKRGMIYAAEFSPDGHIVDIDTKNSKSLIIRVDNKPNTINITTGSNSTSQGMSCVFYINGNGVALNNPDTDSRFGIYIGPNTKIIIRDIRWGRGSK